MEASARPERDCDNARMPHDRSAASAQDVHNLFFALVPGDGVRACIAAAARELEQSLAPRGRWLKPASYHLTLEFLGRHAPFPASLAERAMAAGDGVIAAPFELLLDRAGSFGARRIPAWIGCSIVPARLRALSDALAGALRMHGVPAADPARFVPHVTVLRDAEEPISVALPDPVAWPVGTFALIDSRIQPPAPYRVLREWPLH
jgi:RNA 2',3'-cyclic 3'-phosphodiesterase